MARRLAAFVLAFALVLVALLTAVGQLGKIDGQTLAVVLVAAAVAGTVAAWRGLPRRP